MAKSWDSMIVRILDGRRVDVLGRPCVYLACLVPGYMTHHSAAGYSGCSSYTDSALTCRWRSERGCPPREERLIASARSFHALSCDKARYPFRVRTPRGVIRCMSCKSMIPRVAILHDAAKEMST